MMVGRLIWGGEWREGTSGCPGNLSFRAPLAKIAKFLAHMSPISAILTSALDWRVVRVVEGARLEIV